MFDKFITTDVVVEKAQPVNLDSDTLVSVANNVLTTLSDKWLKFTKHSHLAWSVNKDFDWNEIVKNETHSFALWRWFLNVSSNGTVYYKNNNKVNTIARVNTDTWMVEFNDKWKELIPQIISWQSTKLKVAQ